VEVTPEGGHPAIVVSPHLSDRLYVGAP
jgi:hypothetical protein